MFVNREDPRITNIFCRYLTRIVNLRVNVHHHSSGRHITSGRLERAVARREHNLCAFGAQGRKGYEEHINKLMNTDRVPSPYQHRLTLHTFF